MNINWEFSKYMIEREPMKSQESSGWCGPACVQEVLERKGIKVGQRELSKIMGTTDEFGTSHEQMVEGLKHFNLEVEATTDKDLDSLNQHIKKGDLVILNWMSGPNQDEDGHYSIMEGCNKKLIAINNPDWMGSYNIIRRQDFEDIWFDIEKDSRLIKRWSLIIKK
jgi:ABC-type bacteriocin/lantibiotic exporter with double-glycine peptidase domain